jgi:hypothetical protein
MGTPLTNSLLLVKEATPSVDSTNKPTQKSTKSGKGSAMALPEDVPARDAR